LAEVEVWSDGRNVARQGKATQINTAYGGDAAHAIDGNTSAAYAAGGQTHTQEGIDNPWWEVDLGESYPIDSVVVFNRREGNLGNRLNGFTLRILDAARKPVFVKEGIPAPEREWNEPIGAANPERALHRSALLALTSMRGKESDAFREIAK